MPRRDGLFSFDDSYGKITINGDSAFYSTPTRPCGQPPGMLCVISLQLWYKTVKRLFYIFIGPNSPLRSDCRRCHAPRKSGMVGYLCEECAYGYENGPASTDPPKLAAAPVGQDVLRRKAVSSVVLPTVSMGKNAAK